MCAADEFPELLPTFTVIGGRPLQDPDG